MKKLKVVITDKHIGTSKAIYHTIKLITNNVEISTLSKHSHYLDKETKSNYFILNILHLLPKFLVRIIFKTNKNLNSITHLVCSFPPLRVKDLLKTPENVIVVCNIGHRIHIHNKNKNLKEISNYFSRILKKEQRLFMKSMTNYDRHYFRYYTNQEIDILPITAYQVKQIKRSQLKKTILIGPSHVSKNVIDIDVLNVLSGKFSKKLNCKVTYNFKYIKDIYPDATLDKIINHPAVIIIPYSTFSVSTVEIYQMNIPTFVPVDKNLIDNMRDVQLFPIYASQEQIVNLEGTIINPESPNSVNPRAQKKWIKHMYFNEVENVVRFNSNEDLIEKIYSSDLKQISSLMELENNKIFEKSKKQWEEILYMDQIK